MSELSEHPFTRYNQIRNSPWLFLKYCVYTHDEVDADNPIKPFPSQHEHLRFLTLMWESRKKLAIPKSRRMTASWTFISLALWDCMFHKGRSWALCSKKEEDSKELVQRAEFIYKHIPPEILSPEFIPKLKRGEMQTSPPVMEFYEIYSKLQGFPAGANQLRQRGFSGILEDECCFWENAEEAYASAKPTVDGGGRLIMISSRSVEDGGFFKKICFDQLNAPDIRFPEIPPTAVAKPMEGVEVWNNPNNKFTVIDLHYTADKAKRGEEFREALRLSLPTRRFMMEYEKSWSTFEGKPVYEDFSPTIHITSVKPKVQVGLPLLLGWDSSGLTPACIIAQLQGSRLFIIKELIEQGKGAVTFVPLVAQWIKLNYPQIPDLTHTISFIDPAGLKRSETNEQTYMQYIIRQGFTNVRPGPMTWEKRKEAVDEMLVGLSGGQGKIQIYETDCPILTSGFKGGFRFPDQINNNEPDRAKPIKDIHSHPHDALQYLCGGLKTYRADNYSYNIAKPSYGFQKHRTEMKERTDGKTNR